MNTSSPIKSSIATRKASLEPLKIIHSEQILNGEKVVVIHHHNSQYQLRVTKENKLILTK